jgi:hypothetical protein
MLRLLLVGLKLATRHVISTCHVAHLVRDVLQPRLERLDLGNHLGKLPPDDSLGEQGLAKDVSLGGPLEAFLHDRSGASDAGATHDPSLVVKVGEDDEETAVLRAQHVLGGHDIVKGNVGRASGGRVGGFDLFGLDPFASGDEEDGQAAIGLGLARVKRAWRVELTLQPTVK